MYILVAEKLHLPTCLIHILLSPLHPQNWLKKTCQRSCPAQHGRTASHGSLHPPSKGAV